jgi:hypothetical protein
MPDTYDLQKLRLNREHLEPYVWADQIRRELSRGLKKDETAGEGFVVTGRGERALESAYLVLVKGEKSANKFSESKELSAVFYSHSSGLYVHLTSATLEGHQIKVYFKLVPHKTKELSTHFALIPLGKLEAGEYELTMVRIPLEKRYIESGFKPVSEGYVRRLISQSFSFAVEE